MRDGDVRTSLFERFGGMTLIGELLRFGVAGGCIALVGLGSLYFLQAFLHLWYLLASSLSFLVTFIVAFSLQKFWTFRNKELHRIPRQASMSVALSVFNFFFNATCMYTLVSVFLIHYLLAQCIVYGAIGALDFIVYKFLIFKQSAAAQEPSLPFPQ